jgi:ABC-type multidrug transport system fused ATPase/permease subunit
LTLLEAIDLAVIAQFFAARGVGLGTKAKGPPMRVDGRNLSRMMALCKPYALAGVPAFFIMLAITAAGLLPAWITGHIIDALVHGDTQGVARALFLYGIAVVFAAVGNVVYAYVTTKLREGFSRDLRVRMARALYRGQFEAASAVSVGELGNRLGADIDSVSQALQFSFFPLVSAVLQFALTLAVLITIDWRIAALSLAAVGLMWIPTKPAAKRFARFRRQLSEARDRLESRAIETMSPAALSLVKRSGMRDAEERRYARAADEIIRVNTQTALIGGYYSILSSVVNAVGPVATLSLGAALVGWKQISVGMLVAALTYQMRLYGPAGTMWGAQSQLASLFAILQRVFTIIDIPGESGGNAPAELGDIRFDAVSLRRDGKDVVSNVNLRIARGAHVAIVGPSGCGKSSLLMLLARLYPPASGSITIGGTRLEHFDIDELRKLVAIVAQDEHIFDASLAANLGYGTELVERDAAEMLRALSLGQVASQAGALETIGARGHRLSGGERQRVCLGRALLRRPEILVLDEATSALDVESERRLIALVRERMRGKTLVMVSHRVATVTGMDAIIVMRGGTIVASGTHDELLSSCAAYRDMFDRPVDLESALVV